MLGECKKVHRERGSHCKFKDFSTTPDINFQGLNIDIKLLKPNKALYKNSSLGYAASPAIWITLCYMPPDTSERALP